MKKCFSLNVKLCVEEGMSRAEALELMRRELNRDLAKPERGYVSLAVAQRYASAYSTVLETPYIADTRGYRHYVAPASGEVQLTRRR